MQDYQVKFETITIGNVDFRIRSLQDSQQFSDPDGEAEKLGISSALWPLFGLVWPAGLVLAEIMSSFPVAGKRVLEIGCGLALASIVVHQRGADITASDHHPMAKSFLAENVALNNFSPINFQAGDWSTQNPLLKKFDLIIGSDVLYEQNHPGLLSKFIDLHSNEQVEVMIVDPDRGNHAKFSREMVALGYSHTTHRCDAQEIRGLPFKGRILNYQRQAG
ncbi:methyltransferase [Leptolyngbya sp. FACHB-261]|uniref:class I SAM-dependent methyltransferase n=1 Tax=Leptolyngbya sp. FACHB-261 TaxID=2692806 RepID=UPI0016889F91|nr:methyltransferase domain-containing protein [Leptolyngbya sp. FACHB-261]MBD2103902.1 methyltransferase domain-containing protein [Leptolyngbya sp. FACHB-261]